MTEAESASEPDRRKFLDEDLYDALRYLLCAAMEWQVQESIPVDDKPVKNGGHYVQVYAMDSSTVRARALFEFFTSDTNRNHIGVNHYQLEKITSDRYEAWKDTLNRYIMHANNRPGGQYLSSFDRTETKHLKDMPVDFAREAVRLWRVFIEALDDPNRADHDELAALAELARDKLRDAINESDSVVGSDYNRRFAIPAIDWLRGTAPDDRT